MELKEKLLYITTNTFVDPVIETFEKIRVK